MNKNQQQILIVTGLSGAGMSSSMKNLEDLGYEVFDSFPLSMINSLLSDPYKADSPIAIGIYTRTRGFDSEIILETAKQLDATILFLTADENVLQSRFTATRRRHPLAKDRPVNDGIRKEKELLHRLKAKAHFIIDTSDLSIHDLRRTLEGRFRIEHQGKLMISLVSFGFRWGLPRDADIVMDVRFLKNPYWVQSLRSLSGKDEVVGSYIEQDENFASFLNRFKEMMGPLLPRYVHEGKSYLTVAFGCSGGRHRSVFTIEKLKPWLEKQGFNSYVSHRDIER